MRYLTASVLFSGIWITYNVTAWCGFSTYMLQRKNISDEDILYINDLWRKWTLKRFWRLNNILRFVVLCITLLSGWAASMVRIFQCFDQHCSCHRQGECIVVGRFSKHYIGQAQLRGWVMAKLFYSVARHYCSCPNNCKLRCHKAGMCAVRLKLKLTLHWNGGRMLRATCSPAGCGL